MHLLQNKKKDVKQILQEIKANKTNRSSNQQSIAFNEKKLSRQVSQESSNDARKSYMAKPYLPESSNKYSNHSFNNQNQFRSPPPTANPTYQQSHRPSEFYQQPHLNQPNRVYMNQRRFNPNFYSQQQVLEDPNSTSPFNQFYNQSFEPHQQIRHSRSFSQDSNSTIYEPFQFYQNNEFSRPVTMNQPYLQRNHNTMISNNYRSPSISLQQKRPTSINYENSAFQRHSSQSQFNSSRKDFQNSNFKFFTSQVSVEMEEIRQAEQGLSTQKDSPVKLSDFDSKIKYPMSQIQIIEQNPLKKSIFSSLYDEPEFESSPSIMHKKQNTLLLNKKAVNQSQKIDLQENVNAKQKKIKSKQQRKKNQNQNSHDSYSYKIQVENQDQQVNPLYTQTIIDEEPRIKISEKQKKFLRQKLPRLDRTKIRMNDIMNQVSILLQNINRSKNSIDYDLKNHAGKYYHLLSKQRQKSHRNQFNFGSISEQEEQSSNQISHQMSIQKTLKKRGANSRNRGSSDRQLRMNLIETAIKNRFVENEQVQI